MDRAIRGAHPQRSTRPARRLQADDRKVSRVAAHWVRMRDVELPPEIAERRIKASEFPRIRTWIDHTRPLAADGAVRRDVGDLAELLAAVALDGTLRDVRTALGRIGLATQGARSGRVALLNYETMEPRSLTRNDVPSTTEVAELLGIPRSTVHHFARRGELPARRVGRRWLFLRDRIAAAVVPLDDPMAWRSQRDANRV
jgi:excisionase family DNA binding protein